MQGLEGIASMSRGSLYHIAGTGEPIFERLASEISAYYLLGVEQKPSDSIGDRHRIDVEVRRSDVTIRSRQAFVLSPSRTAKKSPAENLRDALSSPFAISGLPLRVTTFAQQDPGSDKVRIVVAAQVGESGAKPDERGTHGGNLTARHYAASLRQLLLRRGRDLRDVRGDSAQVAALRARVNINRSLHVVVAYDRGFLRPAHRREIFEELRGR